MKILALQKLKSYLPVLALIIFFVPGLSCAESSTLVSTLVIDEFRTRSESDVSDEYIAIANYGDVAMPLSGYVVSKMTPSSSGFGTPIYTFSDFSLGASEKIVLAHADYNGTATLADSNNVIVLHTDSAVIDSVAYGEKVLPYTEVSALDDPARGVAYKRVNNPELGNNRLDFEPYFPPLPIDPNAAKLVISEVLPNPETGDEWFELYNPTSQNISLENLKICDALGRRHCYRFAADSFITAESYQAYEQPITKITLNNDGDWLELYDGNGELITTSGENYGEADNGISLSLFGSKYEWTATPTPGEQNIYTDTIEIEEKTTSKTKKSTAKKTSSASVPAVTVEKTEEAQDVVVAEETAQTLGAETKAAVNNSVLGWVLIGLAISLIVGYICWAYGKIIYNKIKSRDDSARF